jgi:hypothetical protein
VAFTSGSLLAFMEGVLGPLTTQLGLNASDALVIEVAEIVRMIGHPLADEPDDVKLATLARWRAWLAAATAAAGGFDTKAGTVDVKLSKRFDQIMRMLGAAETAAARYPEAAAEIATGSEAIVTSISPAGSPYW